MDPLQTLLAVEISLILFSLNTRGRRSVALYSNMISSLFLPPVQVYLYVTRTLYATPGDLPNLTYKLIMFFSFSIPLFLMC